MADEQRADAENKIDHWRAGEAEIVEVGPDLDVYTAGDFRDLVGWLGGRGRCKLVVSLDQAGFVDPIGLRALIATLRQVSEHGGWLSLVCSREPILKMFRVMWLVDQMDIHETVHDALEARGITSRESEPKTLAVTGHPKARGSHALVDDLLEDALILRERYAGMGYRPMCEQVAREMGRSVRQVQRYWERACELGLMGRKAAA